MLKFYASLIVMALIVAAFIGFIGMSATNGLARALGM